MLTSIIQGIIIIVVPLLLMRFADKVKVINWLGPVVWCYIIGLVMANLPFVEVDEEVSKNLMMVAVPLAIPLLLFSTDFRGWMKLARKTLLSFLFCLVGITVSATAWTLFFSDNLDEYWKIAGMMVGVYSGGTPNMSAIGLSLEVANETFVLLNAADVVWGGLYLLFLLSMAKKVLSYFLPAFKSAGDRHKHEPDQPVKPLKMAAAVGLSGVCLALGLAVSWSMLTLIGGSQVMWVVLTVTTLGIVASFSPRVRNLHGSFKAGEYLLLAFCVAVGSLASVSTLTETGTQLVFYVGLVMFSALLIHYILALIFKIDVDTVLITSTAAIYGPAFVGPVAKALNNKEVIISGLMTGVIGYALANYLGIGLALLLEP